MATRARSTTTTFEWLGGRDPKPDGRGLHYIDHLTHNVGRGRMSVWAGFYERLFNFREIRYFDIKGEYTGLFSQRDDQPGRQDPHSDQRSRRRAQPDRGVSAAATTAKASSTSPAAADDIYAADRRACARDGLRFMPAPPDTYYEMLDERAAGPRRSRRRGCKRTAS